MTHIENESDESNLDDDGLAKHGSLSQQSERQQLGRPQRSEGQGEMLESRSQQSESQRHLADLSGEVIANHYELLDMAGQGNISSIYRARHLLINKIMAVKVLKSHNLRKANLVMRFQREAKLLSALDHPNIIKFHEFGVHSTEQPYLVLEFVDGRTLEDYITCEGPLELPQALEIIIQVCDALEYMHERDVVHRDLKPENIMLAPSESGAQVKLIDFGFADEDTEEDHQDLTKPGSVFGTPNYMSSEQQLGFNVDHRSDIYSLVSVFFFTLTGTPPFKGNSTMETLQKRVSEAPPSLVDVLGDTDVTRRLDHIIARGMANNPDDRYGHINDLRDRLIKIYELAGADEAASPESSQEEGTVAEKKKSATRSNTPALAAAVAICVLCLGGSLFVLWKSNENSQEGSTEAGNTTSTRRLESLWKKADLQGQQQFNTGRYDEAAKSFEKSLRVATKIDPKGEMVKGSLEELIDLAVAQGKEPNPGWLKSLAEINARERATLIADAKVLIPILTRIANGEKIEAVINTTGGASSESLNDLSRVVATRKPLKAGEKKDARTISLEDLCMVAMSRALKLRLSNESTLCYELTEKARLAALTLPPEKRSIMTELVYFQTSFGSSAGEGQKSSDLASQSMPEIEKELKKPRKGQLTVEDANKFVRAYIIATKSLKFDKAHEYLSEAIIIYSQVLGHDSIQVANCLTYDAQLYADQGMFVEARERALEALKIYLGPSVKEKTSDLYRLNDVANLYIFLGKKEMAMKTLTDALNLQQKAVVKDWSNLSDCMVQMTHIGITRGKPEGLDFLCRRAIAIIKRTHPLLKSGPARATRMLGELSKLRGRVHEAESYFKQALQMDLAENKKLALATAAEDYRALADLYFGYDTTNGYRSCVEACQKQVELLDSVYGAETLSVVPAKTLMAKALLRLGEIGKADALIGELENFLAKSDRLNPKERTAVMLVKADSFEKKGNKVKAEELRTKANRL